MTPAPDMMMMEAALEYAARGWAVFPVHWPCWADLDRHAICSCRNAACRSIGKHPRTRRGVTNASKDPNQIRTWWTEHPRANIGIATGEISGIIVIDVDADHGGVETMRRLTQEWGDEWIGLTARTGGGGFHHLFEWPGFPVANRAALWDGVDVRGDGGYIVAPPSLHASGERYAWIDSGPTASAG